MCLRVGYAETSAGSQPSFYAREICRRTSLLGAPLINLCSCRVVYSLDLPHSVTRPPYTCVAAVVSCFIKCEPIWSCMKLACFHYFTVWELQHSQFKTTSWLVLVTLLCSVHSCPQHQDQGRTCSV